MLKAVCLTTEYKTDPVGMDEIHPRFCYRVEGTSCFQSGRQIRVFCGKNEVWNTDWQETSCTLQIEYDGLPLKPFTRYEWQVRVKDEYGKASPWSAKAFFETGFLGTPWTGKWITTRIDYTIGTLSPAYCFRKDFTPKDKVKSARLYATALGLYLPYLNGKEISDICFAPGWTDYHHRVQYQAYDITKLIRQGKNNALSFLFGDGWYRSTISRYLTQGHRTYDLDDMLRMELHLTYADGTEEIIGSDETTLGVCVQDKEESYIRYSDIYMGEHYISHKNTHRWMNPDFDVTASYRCSYSQESHTADKLRIDWNSGAFVRHIQDVQPVAVTRRKNGSWIVDFGQNLVGREKITLRKPEAGTYIVIRHGEMLREDGSLYTDNLRGAMASTVFSVQAAKELETYEPYFTFYGFRYLEISGWPGKLTKKDIIARVLHSDLPVTGSFRCSDSMLNQLYSNVVWGQKSNFLDIPTDCNQRDERLGWTGDTQVFCNTATYNMSAPDFYTKYVEDLNLCRRPNGAYADFVPQPYDEKVRPDGRSGWADAALIVPWIMFKKYGDTRLMEKFFDNMCKWLDLQTEKSGGSYLVCNALYKDHLNLNAFTPEDLVSTAYYAGMSLLASKIAELLGRKKDAAKRLNCHREAAKVFAETFFDKRGNLKVKTQTAALLALHFGCVPEKYVRKTVEFLKHDIKVNRKMHLSTGFLGTPLLLNVLTAHGELDFAYDLLFQTTYPSWLYPVTQGATTMWERWNSWTKETGFGDAAMNSFNHYAYGAVAEWFYETICGITCPGETPDTAGFQSIRLAPQPGKRLKEAQAVYHSASGEIRSAWKRNGKKFVWEFTVPCNTAAEIILPPGLVIPETEGIEVMKNGTRTARPGSYKITGVLS